jgi:hypothetical protein
MKEIVIGSLGFLTLLITLGSADAQNVGIGTSSPQAKLEIVSSGTGGAGVFSTNTSNFALMLTNSNADNSAILNWTATNSATGLKQIIMGINPDYNSNNGEFLLSRNGSNDFLFDVVNGHIALNGIPSANYQLWAGGNTFIQTYGTGGAGVFPTNTANIALTLNSSNAANSVIQEFTAGSETTILGINPTYSTSGIFLISHNGNNDLTMDMANGHLAIGPDNNATPSASYDLVVGGNVQVQGTVTQTSDGRLKQDVKDIDYGLEAVMKLRPVTYKWNEKYLKEFKPTMGATDDHYGFIAQELKKIAPAMVAEDNNYLSVCYTDLIPVLTKAIQDLKAQKDDQVNAQAKIIETQQKEIAALRTESADALKAISELQTQNSDLRMVLNRIERLEKTVDRLRERDARSEGVAYSRQ